MYVEIVNCQSWGCSSHALSNLRIYANGMLIYSNLFIFQENIVYEVEGLSNAPDYFDVDAQTGQVRIISDLRDDPVRQGMYRVSMKQKLKCL